MISRAAVDASSQRDHYIPAESHLSSMKKKNKQLRQDGGAHSSQEECECSTIYSHK